MMATTTSTMTSFLTLTTCYPPAVAGVSPSGCTGFTGLPCSIYVSPQSAVNCILYQSVVLDDAVDTVPFADCRYIVRDLLGQGTFGQVVRCVREDSREDVAVKVIKNQTAFYHQVTLLPCCGPWAASQRSKPESEDHILCSCKLNRVACTSVQKVW